MDILSFFTGGLPAWSLLVICPLLFVAGFVDAIGGGGGLISLPAYLLCGLDPHLVIGTNKLSSSLGTAVATAKYARTGYMVWWLCGLSAITALAGSTLGSHLSLVASPSFLTVFMLVALPVIGFYVLFKRDLGVGDPAGGMTYSRRRTALLSMAIALVVGVYDGFYGPGTGTFLMLLLTGVAKIDVFKAAGVTKAINLTTNVTALTVFLANGTVLVGLGLAGGAFNIAGNYLGARMFSRKGASIVRPIALVVIVVFAIRLVLQLAGIA
ncbi:MAG: TSUP family transporter [Coriobacteriales bacterium]|jgi:uncharacterized membrane protein YfcA